MADTPVPLSRPDLAEFIAANVFTNADGSINGDGLARVLLYMAESAPNRLTDGEVDGSQAQPDYRALTAAIANKADRSELRNGLNGKEDLLVPFQPDELAADKADYAGLNRRPLEQKLINAIGTGGTSPTPSTQLPALSFTDPQPTPTYNSIQRNWSAVANSSGYELQRAPVSSSGVVGTYATVYNGPNTSYNDQGRPTNTTYSYRVRALATSGSGYSPSPYSTPIQASTASGSGTTPTGYQTTYTDKYPAAGS